MHLNSVLTYKMIGFTSQHWVKLSRKYSFFPQEDGNFVTKTCTEWFGARKQT